MRFPLLVSLSLLLLAAPLLGADDEKKPEDLSKMSLEDLLKIEVVAASKISQLISDAPGVEEIVPDYQIDEMGWHSLNDILYNQPGFSPAQDYDRRTVASRGLYEGWNNNHLLLMIDGLPYNDNLYGTAYTWEITPLFFTKNVEILRGPGSALYGSNATNGAINIKSITASDLNNGIMAEARAGEANTQNYDVAIGTTKELFSAVGGFSYGRTNGNSYLSTDASRRTNPDGTLAMFRTRDRRENSYLFGKLDGEGKLKGLSLQLHYQAWQFETGHGWIFYIPDFAESMKEWREMLTGSYHHQSKSGIQQEYVAQYQRHNIDWNQRYYPNNVSDPYGDFYPAGLWELLQTHAQDLFLRGQVSVPLKHESSVIGGVEETTFQYDGDHEHASNVNINNGDDFQPTPGNVFKPLRPWLEWIQNEPVHNVGVYGQWSSGQLLGARTTATAGVRYDRDWFHYHAIDLPDRPTESKTFSRVSPRLALVFHPIEKLTLKAMGGSAFRAPSPTELFGANTYSLASNLRQLRPEVMTTYELAAEYRISRDLLWRMNVYRNNAQNQIAYSVANANLSTNIYSLKTAGAETELLFGGKTLSGFFNYAYAKRLSEKIIDETISLSPHTVTWVPAHTVNTGVMWDSGPWGASADLHLQGTVNRRASDSVDQQFLPYRGSRVGSWADVSARGLRRIGWHVELFLEGKNLLNNKHELLIKNNDFPFDYQRETRRVQFGAKLVL